MNSVLYLERMKSFTQDDLPSLSECTLGALELFSKEGLPEVKIKEFKKPLIIGSGNAIVTAKILYREQEAIFADETSYKNALEKDYDGVLIFSASGGKHAPIIAKAAKEKGKEGQLITCTQKSQAEDIVGREHTIITKKNREPYTYNTSTYMGWIFAKTRENPQEILDFILKKVKPSIPNNLESFDGFLLVTPDNFSALNQLFEVKFIELFGRKIARDVKSYEELKHAITVVPSDTELCIGFGEGTIDFQGEELKVPLPDNCGTAAMMAIAYYTIGQIQEQHPQYFKENIKKYVQRNSKGDFGKSLRVIVE